MPADVSTWEKVAAAFTAVGGIGAAVSAYFSAVSSRASQATSRDAREALAVGIRPRPGYFIQTAGDPPAGGFRWVAVIDNDSEWGATDLEFEFRFRDGRVVRDRAERLAPEARGGREWRVVLGDAQVGQPMEKFADRAVLRFDDERGLARYEILTIYNFTETRKGNIVTQGYGPERHEERIR